MYSRASYLPAPLRRPLAALASLRQVARLRARAPGAVPAWPASEENAMPTRTAKTTWTGGLQDGTGTLELVSSGAGTYEVSFPKRAADDADGTTSPEELIAAAHTSCFAMQFSALLGAAGGSGQSLEVTADVSLGPDPAGGFRIGGIKLTVRGSAQGITPEQFAKIAEDAKATCPVSKALTGTDITLEVAQG
jgi:osmotically inducible protein OsmC